MKLDKDFLLKNKFWVALGVAVPLTLVNLFLLSTTVPARTRAKQKEIQDALTKVKSFSDVKSPEWEVKSKEKLDKQQGLKTVVWEQAWGGQSDMMTWPADFEQEFHYRDGLFAYAIQAERKADKSEGTTAEDVPEKVYNGTIKNIFRDWVEVAGKELKLPGLVTKLPRFQRTAKIKVTLTDEKGSNADSFSALKVGDKVAVTYERGKYYGDELTDSEINNYMISYKQQLNGILKSVDPLTFTGEGVVQLRGWLYRDDEPPPKDAKYFTFVADDWKRNPDLSREAWTAQEDLWIVRELYRTIRQANTQVSKFKSEAGAAKGKESTFTNPYWRLDLKLAGNTLEGKITNLLKRRQKMDMQFLVLVRKDRDPERFAVGGEPLNPDESRTFTKTLTAGLGATGIYGVEQVLTWESAAVKRIDSVSIGRGADVAGRGAFAGGKEGGTSHSHRTYPILLKPFPFPSKKDAPPPDPAVTAAGKLDTTSPNGFVFERYVEITPQARRIPVAAALIVDQEHVSRVQAAFADSSLRFLTTQGIMNRYPTSLRPPDSALVTAGGLAAFAPGRPGADPTRTTEERDANIELILYGIMSLYERYPPRTGTE